MSRLPRAVVWVRRIAALGAVGGIGMLFLPAERVPIPADYGGAAPGAVVVASIDGPSLFAEHCAACHGFGGEGGRGGPVLAGRFAAITRPRVRNQIRRGGISMPAFASTLTDQEIDAIVAFLAELDPPAPPASS